MKRPARVASASSQSVAGSVETASAVSEQSASLLPTVVAAGGAAGRSPSLSASTKQRATPLQSSSPSLPATSDRPGWRPALLSSQSSLGSVERPSLTSAQSASSEPSDTGVGRRWPSLSASSRQTAAPLQSLSMLSPTISAISEERVLSLSSQSSAGSVPSASPLSAQSASPLSTVAGGVTAERSPSLSASTKQTAMPSQFSSMLVPLTSGLPG